MAPQVGLDPAWKCCQRTGLLDDRRGRVRRHAPGIRILHANGRMMQPRRCGALRRSSAFPGDLRSCIITLARDRAVSVEHLYQRPPLRLPLF